MTEVEPVFGSGTSSRDWITRIENIVHEEHRERGRLAIGEKGPGEAPARVPQLLEPHAHCFIGPGRRALRADVFTRTRESSTLY